MASCCSLRSIQWTTLVFLIVCVNGRYSHKNSGTTSDPNHASPHSVETPVHRFNNETIARRSTIYGFVEAQQPPNGCNNAGNIPCSSLPALCINCRVNYSCVYGEELSVTCHARSGVECVGAAVPFERRMVCRYCYQTQPGTEHVCERNASCQVNSSPRQRYLAQCTVRPDVLCLGRRTFLKNHLCNWTRGYSWRTALLLSVVLGGFGADRFYLGMWQEGIGKLFSFGGLGVWTLVDVVLVATGYLGPGDGSLYLD